MLEDSGAEATVMDLAIDRQQRRRVSAMTPDISRDPDASWADGLDNQDRLAWSGISAANPAPSRAAAALDASASALGADLFADLDADLAPGAPARDAHGIAGGPVTDALNQVADTVAEAVGAAVSDAITASTGAVVDAAEACATSLASMASAMVGAASGDPTCCEAFAGWVAGLHTSAEEFLASGVAVELHQAYGAWADGGWTTGGAVLVAHLAPHMPKIARAFEVAQAVYHAVGGIAHGVDALLGAEIASALGVAPASASDLAQTAWTTLIGGATAAWDAAIDGVLAGVFAMPQVSVAWSMTDAGLSVLDGTRWLLANLGQPDLVARAHDEMANTWIPGFVASALDAWRTIAGWWGALAAGVGGVTDGLDGWISAMTGVKPLGGAARAVSAVRDATWGVATSPAWAQASSAWSSFSTFSSKVLTGLREVLLGLPLTLGNPIALIALLGSETLQLLPDCYKASVVDALLPYAGGLVARVAAEIAQTQPYIGSTLAAAVQPFVVGAVEGARAKPVEKKARFLESLAKAASGETAFEMLDGLLNGFFSGLVGELRAPADLLSGVGRLAWSLATGALQLTLWVTEKGARWFDAAGKRHFHQEAPAAAAPAMPEVDGPASAFQFDPKKALGDVYALFANSWEAITAAIGGAGRQWGGLLVEAWITADAMAPAIFSTVGGVIATVFGEAILTKGAGVVAARLPQLAQLADLVVALLKADDIAIAAVLRPVRALTSQVGGVVDAAVTGLRGLNSPLINDLIDIIKGVFGLWSGTASALASAAGVTAPKPFADPLAHPNPLLRAAAEAAAARGDDALLDTIGTSMGSLDRAATASAWTLGRNAAVNTAIDHTIAPPTWFDPRASEGENLGAWLNDRAEGALTDALTAEDEAAPESSEDSNTSDLSTNTDR